MAPSNRRSVNCYGHGHLVCKFPIDVTVPRVLLLQGLASAGLALRRLESVDLEGTGRVVVTAMVTASHRIDADVEKIIGRLSLESTVSAARWQAEVQLETENRPAFPTAGIGRPTDPAD